MAYPDDKFYLNKGSQGYYDLAFSYEPIYKVYKDCYDLTKGNNRSAVFSYKWFIGLSLAEKVRFVRTFGYLQFIDKGFGRSKYSQVTEIYVIGRCRFYVIVNQKKEPMYCYFSAYVVHIACGYDGTMWGGLPLVESDFLV